MNLHGASPWHQKPLLASIVKDHGASPWHQNTRGLDRLKRQEASLGKRSLKEGSDRFLIRIKCEPLLVHNVDDNAGDFVPGTAIESQLSQAFSALLHIRIFFHETQQLLIGNRAGQAIAA